LTSGTTSFDAMKQSKVALAYVFEYFLPHFVEKDTLPVPILLAQMLGIDWVHYTRPIKHIDAFESGLPIVMIGKPQTKSNSDLLLQNKETECTFSNWFMLKSAFRAARSSNILMTGHWTGRTGAGALLFKAVCFLLRKRSFVYIKMDSDVSGVRRIAARGRGWSDIGGKIKSCTAVFTGHMAVDLFSAESPEVVLEMQKSFPRLAKKVALVRNCPSASLVGNANPGAVQGRLKQILSVGRLGTHQKATEILLNGFRQFHSRFPDWRLVLVGAMNSELERLLDENADLCDSKAIVYLGLISEKHMLREKYLESTLFALPSRYEGASLALVEACVFGCVPVCTPVGSARDVLGDMFDVLTVPIGDADALAQKFCELAADSEMLGNASQYLVERSAEFRWEIQLQSIADKIRLRVLESSVAPGL